MKNRWSDRDAQALLSYYGEDYPRELILRSYSGRLLGAEPSLVLHGGGNTSLKDHFPDVFGEPAPALFIKASGFDLAAIEPQDHVAVDLQRLQSLQTLAAISDQAMLNELCASRFNQSAPAPSIETLAHALLPGRFIDHTHADAILALTNQQGGADHVRRALGEEVVVLPYVRPGFPLARQVAEALPKVPQARAMVWEHHGIVVWGDTARQSYDRMIELVSRAEQYLAEAAPARTYSRTDESAEISDRRLARLAPVLRGLLAASTGDDGRPYRRCVLQPLVDAWTAGILAGGSRSQHVSPPLTSDHLIRTRLLPAWVEAPDFDDEQRLRSQLEEVLAQYAQDYQDYFERHLSRLPTTATATDLRPRVVLIPGLGALCAGSDAAAARIARDVTAHTLEVKDRIAAMGGVYRVPEEEHLFDMEYLPQQQLKLGDGEQPLTGDVVMVTGAAGAIGSGICSRLLQAGAHVVATDLDDAGLQSLVGELSERYGERIIGLHQDVSEAESVAASFAEVCRVWGGMDGLVINAGLAHVATLEEMDMEHFRRLERVNTDGTVLLLRAAAGLFRRQATGGDIVLVSTKNVFAPGAGFGAYSATKAAAHQLARVASQEMAANDVRVNMVAPDAVFAQGERRSGLWAEVGPERMRARGLDQSGLEEYYRNRNLLKAKITASQVAEGVLFFLERRTPSTGATLPIDGGLPEATPR